jgi:hypothetical protein
MKIGKASSLGWFLSDPKQPARVLVNESMAHAQVSMTKHPQNTRDSSADSGKQSPRCPSAHSQLAKFTKFEANFENTEK